MRVSIVTDLSRFDESNSIARVAAQQALLLDAHGVDVRLAVCQDFNLADRLNLATGRGLQLDPVVPPLEYIHAGRLDQQGRENFFREVKLLVAALSDISTQSDVIILHNLAVDRRTAQWAHALKQLEGNLPRVFIWRHNMPDGVELRKFDFWPWDIINEPFTWVTYVYPSEAGRRLHEAWWPKSSAVTVPTPVDPLEVLGINPIAAKIAAWCDFFSAPNRGVYAFDLVRWKSKGVEGLLRLLAELNKNHGRWCWILCGAHADNPHVRPIKDKVEKLIKELKLQIPQQVAPTWIWAKEEEQAYIESFVPARVVFSLLRLSTIYIHLSEKEVMSLAQIEAQLCRLPLVLNGLCPAQKELAGTKALYIEWPQLYSNRVKEVAERVAVFARETESDAQRRALSLCLPENVWPIMERLLYGDSTDDSSEYYA